MFNLNIVVVLYQKDLSESKAYTSLTKLIVNKNKFNLIVWNNSPEIALSSISPEIQFYAGKNEFLPNIYNRIAKDVLKTGSDLLMISDDDTDYSSVDFARLLSDIESVSQDQAKPDVGVFIPKIYSNGTLISPGKRLLFKGCRLESVPTGIFPSKNTLAINSGTIITYDCFCKMKPLFNPALRFYGTDTDFFIRYERCFSNLYVLDVEINHSLSEHSNESIERALFRWKDHFYATRVSFNKSAIFIRLLLSLYIFYMRVKLTYRYKSFLFWSV